MVASFKIEFSSDRQPAKGAVEIDSQRELDASLLMGKGNAPEPVSYVMCRKGGRMTFTILAKAEDALAGPDGYPYSENEQVTEGFPYPSHDSGPDNFYS